MEDQKWYGKYLESLLSNIFILSFDINIVF